MEWINKQQLQVIFFHSPISGISSFPNYLSVWEEKSGFLLVREGSVLAHYASHSVPKNQLQLREAVLLPDEIPVVKIRTEVMQKPFYQISSSISSLKLIIRSPIAEFGVALLHQFLP
ncbi:hypothetical protein COP2_000717 [Malus domestica]